MKERILAGLDRFWFAPTARQPLGVLRLLLVGYLLIFRLPELLMVLAWSSGLAPELLAPGLAVRVSPLPFPFPEGGLPWLAVFVVGVGLCSALGLLTRPALVAFTIAFAYLAGVESACGRHDPQPTLVVQVLAVLCVAPGSTACSIDAVWRWWKRRREGEPVGSLRSTVLGGPVPRWGVQLVIVLLAVFYFAAGVSKLRNTGLAWCKGETLRFYMAEAHPPTEQPFASEPDVPAERKWRDGVGLTFYTYVAAPTSPAKRLAAWGWPVALLATASLLLELAFPLVLVGPRFRVGFLVSAAAFHLGVYCLMGIGFVTWVLTDLVMAAGTDLSRAEPGG